MKLYIHYIIIYEPKRAAFLSRRVRVDREAGIRVFRGTSFGPLIPVAKTVTPPYVVRALAVAWPNLLLAHTQEQILTQQATLYSS
jgi:hypothetical protein